MIQLLQSDMHDGPIEEQIVKCFGRFLTKLSILDRLKLYRNLSQNSDENEDWFNAERSDTLSKLKQEILSVLGLWSSFEYTNNIGLNILLAQIDPIHNHQGFGILTDTLIQHTRNAIDLQYQRAAKNKVNP